jgi:hypothetical protein
MIRALTIRFAIMCVGAGALTVALNLIKPAPQLVMLAVMIYLLAGSFIIARYCLEHEDEIPTGSTRDKRRR